LKVTFKIMQTTLPFVAGSRGCRSLFAAGFLYVAGTLVPEAGAASPVPAAAAREWTMGTIAEVRVYGVAEERAARRAVEAALAELRAVDRLMAVQRPESDVSRVNREAARHDVQVDRRVIEVVRAALEMSRLTSGAFDVTVLPAVLAWGFTGPTPHRPAVPARAAAGPAAVVVDERRGTIRFTTPDAGIDLGGIAKGYALDRARDVLRAHGIRAAWLDLGGNVATLGLPPGSAHWRVGIRHPRHEGMLLGVLELGEGAVSTSGDAERFVEDAEGRAGHVIDPRTGRPADRLVTATVLAPSAMLADALSTAAIVMGTRAFTPLARRLGVEAALGVLEAPDEVVLATTPGFAFEPAPPRETEGEGRR
jgi:thiamine biosynthesis lipoprotein